MLPTNAKLQILPQRCIVAPATRIEPADNHLAPKNQYEPSDNPPLGPGSEGTAAARPPGGLHAGMPSSHKVMERPPSAPEVQAGGRPEAHRTATSPRCPTKKGRAAGPRACPEGPAARRVASQAGW